MCSASAEKSRPYVGRTVDKVRLVQLSNLLLDVFSYRGRADFRAENLP